MTDERYDFVPREYWPHLGPAFQGINVNIASIQDALAALAAGGGGGGGTDVTTRQGTDGSWPTITRTTGVHYRWFAAYDAANLPPYASGARAGDELVTPTGTTVIA